MTSHIITTDVLSLFPKPLTTMSGGHRRSAHKARAKAGKALDAKKRRQAGAEHDRERKFDKVREGLALRGKKWARVSSQPGSRVKDRVSSVICEGLEEWQEQQKELMKAQEQLRIIAELIDAWTAEEDYRNMYEFDPGFVIADEAPQLAS